MTAISEAVAGLGLVTKVSVLQHGLLQVEGRTGSVMRFEVLSEVVRAVVRDVLEIGRQLVELQNTRKAGAGVRSRSHSDELEASMEQKFGGFDVLLWT